MVRLLAIMVLLSFPAAATTKLYLTDGTYQLVREYEVKTDRVRFYSAERGQWEEIPLDLIDLKRTREEVKDREAERREEAEFLAAERRAERALARQIASIPAETGAYLVGPDKVEPVKQAETQVVSNKRRSILKVLTPIPIVSGKATVELDGEESSFVVTNPRPEFYIRLAAEERFGIVRLSPQKGSRIVEKWTIVPVTKEIIQEQEQVEIFRHQAADGLYKIWPMQPLEPGQYAVVEYTDGKGNTQVWDFAVRPAPSGK